MDGTGAFVLNAVGTGGSAVITLTALVSHASQTINMTTTSAVTVAAGSTSTAYTIVASDANAHIYIADTNTSAVDAYTGGSAIDTVDLGQGADTFTSGGGNDVFTIAESADTAVATGFVKNAAVPSTAIGTVGMDVITGMTAGMTIVTAGNTTGAGTALIRNGQSMGTAADAANTTSALLIGTYSSSANTFTPSNSGADSMLVIDGNGLIANGTYHGIVLVGYVDSLSNDTMSAANPGVFTSVA